MNRRSRAAADGRPTLARSRVTRNRAMRGRAVGFSLIEVLVSMFIVSMGILALAGLLQAATRFGKTSELRSTATLLANDLADRIRANPAGAVLGASGYDQATAFPTALSRAHPACTAASHCEPADLARADMAAWTTRLRATLPSGSAVVTYHTARAPATDSVDVWIGWAETGTLAASVASERSGTECPAAWSASPTTVRCIFLQVAL
jgi:type IV pilus assembly protein PilV